MIGSVSTESQLENLPAQFRWAVQQYSPEVFFSTALLVLGYPASWAETGEEFGEVLKELEKDNASKSDKC